MRSGGPRRRWDGCRFIKPPRRANKPHVLRRVGSLLFWTFIAVSSIVLFPVALLVWATTALFDRRLVVLHRFTCFWASLYSWLNPAWRVHTEGRMARAAVETAREQVAALVGARPREVVFTSGATEAINAAVWGAGERGTHVIAPAVEHSAVLDASSRVGLTRAGVDRQGRVDPDELLSHVRDDTALVHVHSHSRTNVSACFSICRLQSAISSCT